MAKKFATCSMCGVAVEQRPGRGRPRLYCGPLCRYQGGYELRRIGRRLQALETRVSWLRHTPVAAYLNAYQRRHAEKRRAAEVAAVEREIAQAESRLRGLISEPRGRPLALPHETEAQNE